MKQTLKRLRIVRNVMESASRIGGLPPEAFVELERKLAQLPLEEQEKYEQQWLEQWSKESQRPLFRRPRTVSAKEVHELAEKMAVVMEANTRLVHKESKAIERKEDGMNESNFSESGDSKESRLKSFEIKEQTVGKM